MRGQFSSVAQLCLTPCDPKDQPVTAYLVQLIITHSLPLLTTLSLHSALFPGSDCHVHLIILCAYIYIYIYIYTPHQITCESYSL